MKVELLNRINSDRTFEISPLSVGRILQDKPKVLTLTLPVNGVNKDFELTESRIFSDNFVVKNEFGEILDLELGVHYRGKISGNPNSVVSLTFSNDGIHGLVHENSGAFDLKKIDGVTHTFNEVSSNYDFNCDSKEDDEYDNNIPTTYSTNTITQELPLGLNPYVTTVANYCLRAFWEVDFDMYSLHTGNTISYVTSLFNASSTLFENDGIYVVLSEIKVWTSGYSVYRNFIPANTLDCGVVLSAYRNYYNNNLIPINGDFAHFLTYNLPLGDGDVSNGSRCGVSTLNGPCRTSTTSPIGFMFCMSQLYYTNVTGSSTVYTWNINVITHEQGHQFGSQHTHACVWNGNNTAIDSCSETEGSCANIGYPPPGGGTIMSYCHQIGGVGINFANGFGPQPQQVIVNSINAKTCLQSCGPAPTPLPTSTPTKTIGLTQTPTVTKTLTRTVTTTSQWNCKFSERIVPPYTGNSKTVSGVTFTSSYNSNTSTEITLNVNCISAFVNFTNFNIYGPELGHNAKPFSYTLFSDTALKSIAIRFGNVRPYMSINITTNSGTPNLYFCNGCCIGITGNTIGWGNCEYSTTRYGATVLVESSVPFTDLVISGTNPFPSNYGIIFDFINFSTANLDVTPTPTPTNTLTKTNTSTIPLTPTPTPTHTKTQTLTKTILSTPISTNTKTPQVTLTPTISANSCNPYACTNPIRPPMMVNGIFITSALTGSYYTMPASFSSCNGSVITPANILGLGQYTPFNYTLNFSVPISSIVLYITASGILNSDCAETFTLITDSGNPNITSPVNCFTTINNNVITINPMGSSQTGGGGGIFLIYNQIPFTSISISGPQQCAGSYIVFCADSLVCPALLPTPTPTPTTVNCCSKFILSPNDSITSTGSTFQITTCIDTTGTEFVDMGEIRYLCAKQVSVIGNDGIVIKLSGCECECNDNLPIINESVNYNGVVISAAGSGYATTLNPIVFYNSQCFNLFTSENSVILGYNQNLTPNTGSFIYTLTFSKFVNNIKLILGGSSIGETFTFTSNGGQLTINSDNYCGYNISQNVISTTSFLGGPIGEFTFSGVTPFYQLTIVGNGGGNGTTLSINKCFLDLNCDLQYLILPGSTPSNTPTQTVTPAFNLTPTPTPTYTPTKTQTQTITKTNTLSKSLTPTTTKTPTLTPPTGPLVNTIFIKFNSKPFS
jgi:hypothetical protein